MDLKMYVADVKLSVIVKYFIHHPLSLQAVTLVRITP